MTLQEIKNRISEINQADLAMVNALIEKYENQKIIKEYLKEEAKETGRGEKSFRGSDYKFAVFDFYQRCLEKKEQIQNFIANEAVKLAQILFDSQSIFTISTKNQEILMRNYSDFNIYGELEADYLDFDIFSKKEVHSHIFFLIGSQHKEQMEIVLKTRGKVQFYEDLKHIITPNSIFEEWLNFIKASPILTNRLLVFEELQKLWNSQFYHGFYALALFQIEGIFNIWIQKIAGETISNYERSKLRKKVIKIRKILLDKGAIGYAYSIDYFAYLVPLQRNSFAHKGIIEYKENLPTFKIQENVNDTLYDLKFLLDIFKNAPFPKTTFLQIINNWDINTFLNLSDFIYFLNIFIELDKGKKHSEKFSNDLPNFEEFKQKLLENDILNKLVENINSTLQSKINSVISSIFIFAQGTSEEKIAYLSSKDDLCTLLEKDKVRIYLRENIKDPYKDWQYILNACNVFKNRTFIKSNLDEHFLEKLKRLDSKYQDLFICMIKLNY
jgi:hypothetical protein